MVKINKATWLIIAVIAVLVIYQFGIFNSSKSSLLPIVKENGAKIKAVIVDENGIVKQDLTPSLMPEAFSVISYQNPTGYGILSPATCTSDCSFLAIATSIDNSQGDSNILVESVSPITICTSGNLNPGCSNIQNVLGLASSPGNKRGNLTLKYNSVVPVALLKGAVSEPVISDGMALDEAAFGLIDFKIDITGTYRDPFGNDMPLTNQGATLTLNVQPSVCNDNTPVDPAIGDTDDIAYCSEPSKGKYCRVGADGVPTLTDKASLCGCLNGQYADGEICKSNSCTANACIPNTVLYCLSDGKSLETRCQECGIGKCLKDANGNSASSCSVAQIGVESQCVYSGGTGAGLIVSIQRPSISELPSCGDGIRVGSEQCDGSDFGGNSCPSVGTFSGGTLRCNADCTYDTSSCMTGYVKFRTQFSDISSQINADGIAWNKNYASTCDNTQLRRAGEYPAGNGASLSSSCDSASGLSGYTKMFNINSGVTTITRGIDIATSGFALYKKPVSSEDNDYALAGMVGTNKCIWVGFRDSQASAVATSPYTVDSTKEMNC